MNGSKKPSRSPAHRCRGHSKWLLSAADVESVLRRIECFQQNWLKNLTVLEFFFIVRFRTTMSALFRLKSALKGYMDLVNITTSVFAFTDLPSALPRNEFFLVAPTMAPETEKPSPRP